MGPIDLVSASIAQNLSTLNDLRREPRRRLAMAGAPDLSDITDATEITESIVRPETPSPEIPPGPTRVFRVPSPSTDSDMSKEPEESRSDAPGPTRFFKVPSDTSSYVSDDEAPEQQAAETGLEPYERPSAPTPSRWNPGARTSMASADHSTFSIDLDFGDKSDSFNTPPMARMSIETMGSRHLMAMDRARCRRSEPMPRSDLHIRATRNSLSPRKESCVALHNTVGASTPPPKEKGATSDHAASNFSPTSSPLTPHPNTPTSTDKTPGPEHWGLLANPDKGKGKAKAVFETPVRSREVVNVDLRRNPNIWGRRYTPSRLSQVTLADDTAGPSVSTTIKQLAGIAEDHCDGHAKVVVSEENGRLFVRFKLPTEYAYLFPGSQGADESRFTVTPSAISRSPRVTFAGHTLNGPTAGEEHASDPDSFLPSFPNVSLHSRDATYLAPESPLNHTWGMPSSNLGASSPTTRAHWGWPAVSQDHTLVVSDFASSSPAPSSNSQLEASTLALVDGAQTQEHDESSETMSALTWLNSTPDVDSSMQLSTSPQSYNDALTEVFRPSSPGNELDSSGHSAVGQNPIAGTPSISVEMPQHNLDAGLDESPATLVTTTYQTATPTKPKEGTPDGATPTNMVSPTHDSATATPITTPNVATSFTPVNNSTPTIASSMVIISNAERSDAATSPAANPTTTTTPTVAEPITAASPARQPSHARHDDDSSEREYMLAFIQRSRPKRLSTTETGSPVAPTTKRLPLGAKSPNTSSPQKAKRKVEEEEEEEEEGEEPESPFKKLAKPAKKKAKLATYGKKPKHDRESETEQTTFTTTENPSHLETQTDDTNSVESHATRRSSRIRSQTDIVAPKSSIPTAIKIGRSGAGRAVAGATSTTQEVHRVTSMNTVRNRGEYPAEVLVRVAEEQASHSGETRAERTAKGRKNVVWSNPLESYQDGKPRKRRGVAKAKATQGETGVSKPKQSTPAKPKAFRVAEGLGMADNGTPLKPQRVTRSRMKHA